MAVKYVKGMHGFVRFPLGFSPSSGKRPDSNVGILFGAGQDSSNLESSSIDGAHYLDFWLANVSTGTTEVFGCNMTLDVQGTSPGYAYFGHGKVTTGTKSELGAAYLRTQLSGGQITGQAYAAFLEFIVDSGISNMPSGGVLQLVGWVDGTLNAVHSFIQCRDYGTNKLAHLFGFLDTSATPGAETTIYSPAGFSAWLTNPSNQVFIPVSRSKPSTTAFYGRGASTSSRETLGTSITDGISLYLQSAGNSITVKGMDIDVKKTGTSTSCIGLQAKADGTDGSGSFLIGIYGVVQNSGTGERPVVQGYYVGGEFEVVVDNTVTNTDANAAVCLDVGNNAASSPGDPTYIFLNNWGSNKANYFFRTIGNEAIGTTTTTTCCTTLAGDVAPTHAVKIQFGGTDLWLLARNAIT
jgi:hypothetical protein